MDGRTPMRRTAPHKFHLYGAGDYLLAFCTKKNFLNDRDVV